MSRVFCMCHFKDKRTDGCGCECSPAVNYHVMKFLLATLAIVFLCAATSAQPRDPMKTPLREVNNVVQPAATSVIAIVGATLIDGNGGPVITDSAVIIRGDRIVAVGKRNAVKVP